MAGTLPITINREAVHAVEPGTDSFETSDSFTVELENSGSATHVHLHLDDDLSRVASLERGNYFVEAGDSLPVQVRVDRGPRPVSGRLKVVTGYGAETAYVDVTIVEPESDAEAGVQVDERLSRPPVREEPEESGFDLPLDGNIAVAVLAALAIGLAIGAVLVSESLAVTLGVLVVLAGVVVAAALLVR